MKIVKIFFALLLIVFIGCNYNQQKNKTISIGVILPLTGDYAKIGADIKKAIEIAEQDAENKGLIKKNEINVIFEDSKMDATTTVNAYNKLRSSNNMQAVITVTSKCVLALKPLANKDKILLLNASAISTEIEDNSDYCFSLIPDAKAESVFLSDYILKNKNISDIALVYRNDQSGKSFCDEFSKYYSKNGGLIQIVEAHPTNTTDFKTIIAKLKEAKSVKAVFMASLGVETANFLKQSRELNFNIPVFTYETINQPNALDLAGNLIDNVEFVSPRFSPQDTAYKALKKSLKSKYGSDEINFYMVSHYNAFMLLANLIHSGNTVGSEFKANVPNVTGGNYLGSKISIDSIGHSNASLGIYGYHNQLIYQIK
jgi:branched-chain amino acid transport system substrate-binding protein